MSLANQEAQYGPVYVKDKIHKTKSLLLRSDYDTPSQYIKDFKKFKDSE